VKTIIQIPVKNHSERVPGKNYRLLGGKELWKWSFEPLMKLQGSLDIDVVLYDEPNRPPWTLEDWANGNHILREFAFMYPNYDLYLQRFVTAPFLSTETVIKAVEILSQGEHDSIFTATRQGQWVWHNGKAVNYDPNRADGLPRSQDAQVLVETTGLYGITRTALLSRGTRLGENPFAILVSKIEALDIDTEEDFSQAEILAGRGTR